MGIGIWAAVLVWWVNWVTNVVIVIGAAVATAVG